MSLSVEARVCSLGVRGRSLVVLPAHFGRLRGLSHDASAPVAKVAANEAADNAVYKIFQRVPEFQEADSYCSSFDKHALCGKIWGNHRQGLLEKMEDDEREFMVENSNYSLSGTRMAINNALLSTTRV